MNRRTVLRRTGVGVAALVALSGCTEETLEEAETNPPFLDVDDEDVELPVEQGADVVERGIRAAEDADVDDVDALESFLEAEGLPVETLDEVEKIVEEKLAVEREDVDRIDEKPHGEEPVLELEFVQSETVTTGLLYSVGLVAGGYAALFEAGHDTELLEATVLDPDGDAFGSFHVLAAWAEEYNAGEVSARAYGGKPWDTMKSE